jgi:ABC-type bacteriocin/lantibiotic exporter with double-glycine peptidase domain
MPILDFPSGRQTFGYDCGAKALQMVMAYYGVDAREDELLHKLNTDNLGTRVKSVAAVAQSYGFGVIMHTGATLGMVRRYIDNRTPVIVLVQAWADKYMSLWDWHQTNDHGHYVVVIGYNDRTVLFEDPAAMCHTWLSSREFMARWHDIDPDTNSLLSRFTMILTGRQAALRMPERMG